MGTQRPGTDPRPPPPQRPATARHHGKVSPPARYCGTPTPRVHHAGRAYELRRGTNLFRTCCCFPAIPLVRSRRARERAPRLIGPLPRGGEYKPGPPDLLPLGQGDPGLPLGRAAKAEGSINCPNWRRREREHNGSTPELTGEDLNARSGDDICCCFCRLAHHKGVNLTDVKVNDTQEFVQIVPNQKSSIEDVWQVRVRRALQGSLDRGRKRHPIGMLAVAGQPVPQLQTCLRRSMVAHDWILTATHCVHNYRRPEVYHPRYDDRSHDYDIALMKLTAPLNSSDAVRAVCLPLYQQDFPHGTHCWISGWGYTRPEHVPVAEMLKEDIVPLISTKKCNSSCMNSSELTPRMLHAGYLDGKVDACQGEVCNTINKTYNEFLPSMQSAEDLVSQVDSLSGKIDQLKSRIENEVRQDLNVAIAEFTELKQQLERDSLVLSVLKQLQESH